MARYPNAVWKPLPENKSEPRLSATLVALHSAVTNGTTLFSYFARKDVTVESHFYIRKDGTVEQYIDTARQADAQREGNDNCISIETWDGGHPDTTPWNINQINAIVALLVWCHKTHNIPLITATGPNGKGVGYHSQFRPEWARDGRTCPGTIRVPQVGYVIRKAALVVSPAKPAPSKPAALPTLVLGFRSTAVGRLQAGLNAKFPAYSHLKVDNSFGPATLAVVKEFQRRTGLVADGRVGPATRAKLEKYGIRL